MHTKFILSTSLLVFCGLLLEAQTPSGTVIINENVHTHTITKIENGQQQTWQSTSFSDERTPCRVFIGVGTSPESGGLRVTYTVDNTPATTYGVQVGDVIQSLDNVAVSTQPELLRERNKHQQGEEFTLNVLRNGSPMTIKARFKSCSQEEQEQVRLETSGRRPILGIYEKEDSKLQEGLEIGEVIPGKGAALAGLQSGDILTLVDGTTLNDVETLHAVLATHKPGDPVPVAYLRDGQMQQALVTLSGDRKTVSFNVQRDPCAVFIGVYTTDAGMDEKGVRVTGVIDNTPAKESNVQPGDIILALDDQPVNDYDALSRERDKHQPGDTFRLKVLRGGSVINVNATFKSCPKNTVAGPVKVTPPAAPTAVFEDATLEVTALDIFPNPNYGLVNVQFEAEAVPTTVRITDAAGRIVYENVLRQFAGTFSEQIDLQDQKPGVYTVSLQQGKKVLARNVVLLSRV